MCVKEETTLSKNITKAGRNPEYDAACKKVLSYKPILAWIMKDYVDEFKGCSIKDIADKYIDGEPQISKIAVNPDELDANDNDNEHMSADLLNQQVTELKNEDKGMNGDTIFYDIRFQAYAPKDGELIKLIINVEAQKDANDLNALMKRAMYYCSRLLSAQHGHEFTKAHYEKLKKVYSIWICRNTLTDMRNSAAAYGIEETVLSGNASVERECYDLLKIVRIHLGDGTGEKSQGAMRLLDVLLSARLPVQRRKDILQEDYKIAMTEDVSEEVSVMCNLSEGLYDIIREDIINEVTGEVREKVREEVQTECIKQGINQGKFEAVKNIMENLKCTIERAMEIAGIAPDEYHIYQNMI